MRREPHHGRHTASGRRAREPLEEPPVLRRVRVEARQTERRRSHIQKCREPTEPTPHRAVLRQPLHAPLVMTIAGARPNDTMSARLSYSLPNSLDVLVNRATRPSRLSKNIAAKIAQAAIWKLPSIDATIE